MQFRIAKFRIINSVIIDGLVCTGLCLNFNRPVNVFLDYSVYFICLIFTPLIGFVLVFLIIGDARFIRVTVLIDFNLIGDAFCISCNLCAIHELHFAVCYAVLECPACSACVSKQVGKRNLLIVCTIRLEHCNILDFLTQLIIQRISGKRQTVVTIHFYRPVNIILPSLFTTSVICVVIIRLTGFMYMGFRVRCDMRCSIIHFHTIQLYFILNIVSRIMLSKLFRCHPCFVSDCEIANCIELVVEFNLSVFQIADTARTRFKFICLRQHIVCDRILIGFIQILYINCPCQHRTMKIIVPDINVLIKRRLSVVKIDPDLCIADMDGLVAVLPCITLHLTTERQGTFNRAITFL
ncbi:MAG: hypothetical protein BWZ04_00220 [Firmicutes bacterium ADurb.BinA205]|nr:MAG: hypothetical protein BWZ04_00220 [Firmicutes bacterium ADurb.BinA205]